MKKIFPLFMLFLFSGCAMDFWNKAYSPLFSAIDVKEDRAAIEALITGNKYYLNQSTGSDTSGDGSSSNPWKTLAKAQAVAVGGDGIYLSSGNYGALADSDKTRDSFLVIINVEGQSPVLTSIDLNSKDIIIYGMTVSVLPVSQTSTDPQYAQSDQSTYNKTLDCVTIDESESAEIHNCSLIGNSKYLTNAGVRITDSINTVVAKCDITAVHRSISYIGSINSVFYYNHIHAISGSAFHSGEGNNYVTIEGNNVYDSNYDYSDNYCPRAKGANYHGSAASLRCSNVTIRNNIFHDGFNSSGIMTYNDSGITFNNILIENNLIYDIRNTFVIRFYNAGNNIVVRNNIIAGHDGSTGAFKYDTVLIVHNVADGFSGSGISLYNNIFIGSVQFGDLKGIINQGGNIYYSCFNSSWETYSTDDMGNGSKVVSTGATSTYFESGFFNGSLIFSYSSDVDPTDDSERDPNPKGHGQTLDFTYASGSEAINFGLANHQTSDSLGSVDANGFIQKNGVSRSTANHNAGAY